MLAEGKNAVIYLKVPSAQEDDPWSVRVLPRATFGAAPTGGAAPGPEPANADAVVLHHLMGSWRGGARRWRSLAPLLRWLRPLGLGLGPGADAPAPALPAEPGHGGGGGGGRGESGAAGNGTSLELYPVSVAWEPPFSMLVDLAGGGDVQASAPRRASGPHTHTDAAVTSVCHRYHALLPLTANCSEPAKLSSRQRSHGVPTGLHVYTSCTLKSHKGHVGSPCQSCPSAFRLALVRQQPMAGFCCRRM